MKYVTGFVSMCLLFIKSNKKAQVAPEMRVNLPQQHMTYTYISVVHLITSCFTIHKLLVFSIIWLAYNVSASERKWFKVPI